MYRSNGVYLARQIDIWSILALVVWHLYDICRCLVGAVCWLELGPDENSQTVERASQNERESQKKRESEKYIYREQILLAPTTKNWFRLNSQRPVTASAALSCLSGVASQPVSQPATQPTSHPTNYPAPAPAKR